MRRTWGNDLALGYAIGRGAVWGALLLGATGLALAGVPAKAASAQQRTARPKPVFGKLRLPLASFVLVSDALGPGDHARMAVRVTKRARCGLTLVSPNGERLGPFTAVLHRYGVWHWTVPANVRGGAWRGSVTCHAGRRSKTLATRISAAFTAGNSKLLVAPKSMSVSVRGAAPRPDTGGAGGKGGGNYPNDDAVCKWTGTHDSKTNPSCHAGKSWYDWGYKSANGGFNEMSERGFVYRNCTDYVAWFLGLNNYKTHLGNADEWKGNAGTAGLVVNDAAHPAVGDVAWWGSGHVAVVTAVNANNSVTIAEYNGDRAGHYDVRPNVRADAYLHRPEPPKPPVFNPAAYNGHIVKQDNGDIAAWLVVDAQGHRNWIADQATYNCLKAVGHPGPDFLNATLLSQLPDQTGVKATCFNPADYNGHIVKQDNGDVTSWLVVDALGHRNWIADQATYNCLKAQGHPGPDFLSAAQLNQLPDQNGVKATCTTPPIGDKIAPSVPGGLNPSGATTSSLHLGWSASSDNVGVVGYDTFLNGAKVSTVGSLGADFGGLSCGTTYTLGAAARDASGNISGTASVQASTSACPPPPPPATRAETVGPAGSGTFTNWTNAGGTLGPRIGAYQAVQITCRLTGFAVADGNTWWYRVASGPWSNAFYAPADNFYNNGATSGSLNGTPFFDPAVPTC